MKYKIEPTNYTLTLRATHTDERFPLAYASIIIEEENGYKIGRLVGLIRHPEFKGQGICRDLFLERIRICEEMGCDKVYSAVYHKRDGIIGLFEELGFEEIEPLTPEYRRFVLEF